MTHRILVEPTAERGIREAFRYIEGNRSRAAAIKWFNALDKKIQTLSKYPLRCPLAAESDKFPEDIRELLHGPKRQKYRILFTIRDDTVHVLYVRHAARDELEP
jgi:plasmid stabilization system protein ParE